MTEEKSNLDMPASGPAAAGSNAGHNASNIGAAASMALNRLSALLMRRAPADAVPAGPSPPVRQVSEKPKTYVQKPSPYDVLLGRGIYCQKHAGNQRFHKILEQFKLRYCNGGRRDKTLISDEIVDKIQNCGDRSGRPT